MFKSLNVASMQITSILVSLLKVVVQNFYDYSIATLHGSYYLYTQVLFQYVAIISMIYTYTVHT